MQQDRSHSEINPCSNTLVNSDGLIVDVKLEKRLAVCRFAVSKLLLLGLKKA